MDESNALNTIVTKQESADYSKERISHDTVVSTPFKQTKVDDVNNQPGKKNHIGPWWFILPFFLALIITIASRYGSNYQSAEKTFLQFVLFYGIMLVIVVLFRWLNRKKTLRENVHLNKPEGISNIKAETAQKPRLFTFKRFFILVLPPLAAIVFLYLIFNQGDRTTMPVPAVSLVFFSCWSLVLVLFMVFVWMIKSRIDLKALLTLFIINILVWSGAYLYDTFYGHVKDIDGNEYTVVHIGNQYWMGQNLCVTHYRDGTTILDANDSLTWANANAAPFPDRAGTWCNHRGHSIGNLYNWAAVKNERGICPLGWHIPSDAEWQQLMDYQGGVDNGNTHFNSYNIGYVGCHGFFYDFNFSGYWSSTLKNGYLIWCRYWANGDNHVNRAGGLRGNGFSVRCVKN